MPTGHFWQKNPDVHKQRPKQALTQASTNQCIYPSAPYLCCLVSKQSVLSGLLAVLPSLELSLVAVVVSLHLQVEDLGLARRRGGDEVLVKELKNAAANIAELLLNLFRNSPRTQQANTYRSVPVLLP